VTLAQIFTIKEFTGRHMIVVLLLFFGTVFAANMTMTWFALGSWSGLVAKNGYVASIEFKDKQADYERQRKLGWKSQLRVENGHVFFSVKDATGKAVSGLSIIGGAKRPATEKSDTGLTFNEAKPGEYLATAPTLPGQWQIEIHATSASNQSYRKKYKVLVKTLN